MSLRCSRYRGVRRASCVVLLGLAFAGCDSNDDDSFLRLGEISFRGQLVQEPTRVASFSSAALSAALADPSRAAVAQLAGAPICNVDVHHFQYRTVGAQDENTVASGALMVPTGDHERCRGKRPIVLYGHGTAVERAFNLANVFLTNDGESFVLAAGFAAHGYIVVAPNLAGYDTSTLPYHPYLNAAQNAKDMIDALRAARRALPTSSAPNTRAGSKLFVTGYSAGGHVAMATHRALEEQDIRVTAAAPLSGPYALSTFGDRVYDGQVNLGATIFSVLIATSYQRAYGDLYDAATELFEARDANGSESLLPSNVPIADLFAQGLLMQSYWSTRPVQLTVLDVDSPVVTGERFEAYTVAFAAAKAEAEANGIVQLLLSYHGLVSPYCMLAARAFFDGF